MGFGLSFGSNKTKSTTTSTLTKDETTNQTQTGTQSTTGTTTTSGTQSQSGTSTGTSSTNQTGTSNTSGTSQQQTTQTQTSFGQKVLGGLEDAVTSLLSKVTGPDASPLVNQGVGMLGDFDPESFVERTLASAQAQQGSKLDEILGGIFSRVGGTEKTNSAATLLANRARGEAAANLAGIGAQAQAQANEIVRQNVATGLAQQDSQNNLLVQLGNILKGGSTSTSGASSTQTAEQQQTAQSGATNTSESNQSNTTSNQTQQQSILEAIQQILNGTTSTTGTENSTTIGKKSGGGLSLSI